MPNSNIVVQPKYSHKDATQTGTGAWIDVTAFTEDSSVLIDITGTANVLLEGTLDINNPLLVVDCSQGGTVDTVWWRIPKEVMYLRTNITSGDGFTVSSCFSRGMASLVTRVESAQNPVTFSVPDTLL